MDMRSRELGARGVVRVGFTDYMMIYLASHISRKNASRFVVLIKRL
jgi:hypothetical protein